MSPKDFYDLYLAALKTEGLQVIGSGLEDPPWERLKNREQIAWGIFFQNAKRELKDHQ